MIMKQHENGPKSLDQRARLTPTRIPARAVPDGSWESRCKPFTSSLDCTPLQGAACVQTADDKAQSPVPDAQ
jgi:hypothetical protein